MLSPRPGRRQWLRLEHKVALLTIAPIVALGIVLASVLDGMFEDRLLASAERVIAPNATSMTEFLLTPDHFDQGFPDEVVNVLDLSIGKFIENGVLVGGRIYSLDGRVLWSSDPSEIGRRHQLSAHSREAADGGVHATLTHGDAMSAPMEGVEGRSIAIAVPSLYEGSDEAIGISELYLSDDSVSEALAADRRKIAGILVAGLLLLWVLLYRIVSSTSRTLRRQARENHRLAVHDTLTGLPNRTFFNGELAAAISRARRATDRKVGVLLLDLDRFKEVNDSLGHHEGDHLLVQIAERLRGALRGGDTVARFGGDEFAVVLHDIESVEDAIAGAERIHRMLDAPVDLGELRVQVDASIGIAVFPDHGDDGSALVQRADVAMYTAKGAGADWSVYDAAVDPNSPHRLALVSQLRGAIESDELVVHYQPVADLRSGETVAMEALVRWQHPVRGLVPPNDFIPAAEGSGLIRPLTLRVLRDAMVQCRSWLDDGNDVSVAVNLSARNAQDPRCPEDVLELLAETGLPPGRLIVEITESAVLGDPATALAVLTKLRSHGVRVALDDFGTGYSSLTQLKDLPVDEIKIDRSFVSRVGADPTTTAIVESIVELGERLAMHVVAEGVEEQADLERLSALGCQLAQGYFFSRPLPAEAAGDWLAAHAARAVAP